jgi:hypothetical protein
MKKALYAVAVLLLVFSAFVARQNSTGKKLIDTGKSYMEHLAAGEEEEAYSFLSDSLAGFLTPGILGYLQCTPATGSIRTGRNEYRGFTLSISLAEGGSRTLWLREETNGKWKISGDSSLDNLLGNATVLCFSYAKGTVIPAITEGEDPGDYLCPVSGSPYYVEDGKLFCPDGHLGNGIDVEGSACSARRDSLAAVVFEYVSAGYEYPSSFSEMYERSNGAFSQRGGFHCPNDGYSYYKITSDGVYCPFHRETGIIKSPGLAESPDSTFH